MQIRISSLILAFSGCLMILTTALGCSEPPGIEEAGGEIYVYELAPDIDGSAIQLDPGTQKGMIAALESRIDPTGDIGIRVSFNEDGHVEIAVPGDDQTLRKTVRLLATSTGRLEFLIIANVRDHPDLIEEAKSVKGNVIKDGEAVVGRWVNATRQGPSGDLTIVVTGRDEVIRDGKTGEVVEFSDDERQRLSGGSHVQNHILREKGLQDLQVLAVVDKHPELNFQGIHLATVSESVDENSRPCLNFTATERGAKVLAVVTSTNLPDRQTGFMRKLGIIFDDQLVSAPRIMSTISDQGRITGDFTQDEIRFIADVLRAGELPANLQKEPIKTIAVPPTAPN